MDASKIIDDLGGTAEVARLCKVKMPSVSDWRKSGIPEARRMYLEAIRPDVFAQNQPDPSASRPPAAINSDAANHPTPPHPAAVEAAAAAAGVQ